MNPKTLNALTLAYYGDAVYEAAVRRHIIESGECPAAQLHKQTVAYVNATAQARFLDALQPELTVQEAEIVRRGRNTASAVPKSASVAEYRAATGLEALFGYLALNGEEARIAELMRRIFHSAEAAVKG